MWSGGYLLQGLVVRHLAFSGIDIVVLAVIMAVAVLIMYLVFKALLLALPAIILAAITWFLLHDYTLTAIVFVVTLVITLIKKL